MHILAFLLMFVVLSIGAACDGDYSGIAAIAKFVGGVALFIGMLFLFTQPALLVVVILIVIAIIAACSLSK